MSVQPDEPCNLTREELYDLVWSQSMRQLAPTFGISSDELGKICKRHKIPSPPMGYWARVVAGKAVQRTPLPPIADPRFRVTGIRPRHDSPYRIAERGVAADVQDEEIASRIAAELRADVVVPERVVSPHPLAEGMVGVSETLKERATRIVDTLLRAFESRGYKVAGRRFEALGEELILSIREIEMQVEGRDRYFKYGDAPTGRLALFLAGEGQHWHCWRETNTNKSLEDRLQSVMAAVPILVHEVRRWRKEEEHWRIEYRRKRAEKEAKRRRRQEARRRIEALVQLAGEWRASQDIRDFVAAARAEAIRRDGMIEEGGKMARWLAWAERCARRLDPLAEPKPLPPRGRKKKPRRLWEF